MRKGQNDKALRPVHPNAGIQAAYRKKLDRLIDEMHRSITFWIRAEYRRHPPLMAEDRNPAQELRAALRKLTQQWQKNFNEAAPNLAEYFAKSVRLRSDATLRKILRDGGISVKLKMTRTMQDVVDATIAEQVNLIKSIPERYLTQVQGMVMRSIQTGRDMGALSKQLQEQFGVTKRRAATIARDQNNKASAAMTAARQDHVGITEGDWYHSGAGKHPRPTHVAMNGKRFNLRKGMWDSAVGRWILPAQEPNCRCFWRPVIKGFS